ncbi:MAG: T9SS type A sorting domain-containing protein [Chitinophagales bacterium]|nr:T9SS type A sorting domain-containing protein [Chitinophagales bacterium]MBP9188270.1 T9SS type A sorting domain-containing protein [Chitinophagales bacterium]MBP9547903.1 T9SS type A sorting domain-containing protein [Chitinophagales bacterium]MBP9705930.1 T9SS type A sorting domain-containing protein [Chitinophagales bacterium]
MKKFTPYVVLTILCTWLNPVLTSAQFTPNWYEERDLGSYAVGRIIQADLDEATGETSVYTAASAGTYDAMNVTRRTNEGDLVWSKNINNAGYSSWSPSAMHIDDAGNVIVSGQVYNTDEMIYELFILSYSSGGGFNWAQFINEDDSYSYFIGMEPGADGDNVYIAAWTYNYVGATYTSELRLYSVLLADGTVEWDAVHIPGDTYSYFYDMVAGSTGVYFTGYLQDVDYSYDMQTIKFDTEGNYEWTQLFEADTAFEFNFGYALAINNSGNLVVAGSSGSGSIITIVYHPDGTLLNATEQNFGASAYIFQNMLLKDNGPGSTYFAASVYKNGAYGIYVARLNEDGSTAWQKKVDGQTLVDLEVPEDMEGCYIVVSEYVDTIYNYVPSLFMFDPSGNKIGEMLSPLKGYYSVADFSTLNGSEFYITGQKQNPDYSYHEITSRWDLDSVMRLANASDVAVNVFPNPASDFVYVKTEFEEMQIELIDINGRVVQQYNGNYEIALDVSDLSAGVYMLRIISDNKETLTPFVKE